MDDPSGQNWDFDTNLDNGDIFDVWYVTINGPNWIRIARSKIFNIANTQPEMLNALEWDIDPISNSDQRWVQVECGPEGHAYAIWEDLRNGQSPNEVWMAMYW